MQIPIKIGYYAIGEKIGEGNYAEVKLATHTILNTQVNKHLSRASIKHSFSSWFNKLFVPWA